MITENTLQICHERTTIFGIWNFVVKILNSSKLLPRIPEEETLFDPINMVKHTWFRFKTCLTGKKMNTR